MSQHTEPPDTDAPGERAFGVDAVLAAVDGRLVAELGFPRRLVEPPRWARDLLDLGGIVNALMPLMGDWMARWSSALSYDDTDAPLVHARWTDPAALPVEEAAPRVRARAVAAGAHHSVRISERVQTHVVEWVAPASGSSVSADVAHARATSAPQSTRRPVVAATAVVAEGQGGLPHPGAGPVPSGTTAPASAAPPSTAPSSTAPPGTTAPSSTAPATRADGAVAPIATATGVRSTSAPDMPSARAGMPSDMPTVAPGMPHPSLGMPSGMPSADVAAPVPAVASAVPALPDAGPLTTPSDGAHPSGAATGAASAPVVVGARPTAPGATAPVATAHPTDGVGPPGRVHPPGESVDIDALLAAADGRSRVVSRGVRHGRPQSVTVQARRAPSPAAHRSAAATPPDAGRRAHPPLVQARSASPAAGGPVVAARHVTGRTATPVVRGGSVPLPQSATPSHGVGPAVSPPPARSTAAPHAAPTGSASPRMVPLAPPQSAQDLARMLGERAPSPAPPPAPAPQASPPPGPVTLAPAQIRTIAGVVEQRVIRHIERERARTRTRV